MAAAIAVLGLALAPDGHHPSGRLHALWAEAARGAARSALAGGRGKPE